jgi:hypothetical protein
VINGIIPARTGYSMQNVNCGQILLVQDTTLTAYEETAVVTQIKCCNMSRYVIQLTPGAGNFATVRAMFFPLFLLRSIIV